MPRASSHFEATPKLLIVLLILTTSAFHGIALADKASSLVPTELKCEGAIDPLGIDAPRPRLTWILRDLDANDRGQVQTARQILVAGDLAALKGDRGDVWDSEKVASDQSVRVPYAGRLLASHQVCFWKVRAWDRDGNPTAWSQPARWSMGMLAPADRVAKWIGMPVIGREWKDYSFESRFTVIKRGAGFFFRSRDGRDAYLWQINISGPQSTLKEQVCQNNVFRVLKEVPLGKILNKDSLARPHDLRIIVTGDKIETVIDGQSVDTTRDSTLASGGVGYREAPDETVVILRERVTPVGDNQQPLLDVDFTRTRKNPFCDGEVSADGLTITKADVLQGDGERTPLLRHAFALAKPVREAWVYGSALGLYELRLNGQRVGEDHFTPGWTDYHQRIQYQTYDVTSLVRAGDNVIAAQLAPGWYAGRLAWFGPNRYGDVPRLFAQLHVEYTDGSAQIVGTDESWRVSAGAVVAADNLTGETYDARLEQAGWDSPGFDDHAWRAAESIDYAVSAELVSQADPPVRVIEIIRPIAVTEPKPGAFVFDLGQNITGIARMQATGPAGTAVTLRYGERLDPADGSLYTGNLGGNAIDKYILAGRGAREIFEPRFTFHGFRYLEITGFPGAPTADDVTGLAVVTSVPDTGSLETSDPLINQIESNFYWGGRDAFMSIPMDCPQRGERLGWMGDACFYVTTAAFNFDMSRFYNKWERDIADAQTITGMFPHIAPNFLGPAGYGGGWGDAGVVVPYVIWQRYGDVDIIAEHYAAFGRWIECLRHESTNLIVSSGMAPAGDWLNYNDGTSPDVIATAYFAYDAKLISQLARALGKEDDAKKYEKLFDDIRDAFAAKWVSADGTVAGGSQTAYVMALHVGLVPPERRAAVARHLVESVLRHDKHLSTGFVGTQWILPTLTDIGRNDLAYAILEQKTIPSWGYMVDCGATTVWE